MEVATVLLLMFDYAGLVEQVDTTDLKSVDFGRAGSSPAVRTTLC